MDETPDLFELDAPKNPTEHSAATVVLIDAFSQIFRAFFAVRELTNRRGEPVNALFVFTRLLLQLEARCAGCRGALLFDRGRVEFRLALKPDYKANRPPMPDALKLQIPAIEEMAAAFGWPCLGAAGYEADDLAGGFAAAVRDPVLIVTSDKDLSALVDERVKLLKPARGGGFEECDAAAVAAKFGVAPELIPDFLALLGDASDNIDGVPGIGAKSAAELLNSIGSAAAWYKTAPPKFAGTRFEKKLTGQQALIERNLALVRLKCDLPPELSDCDAVLTRRSPDWEKIAAICADNDFNSLRRELPVPFPEPERSDELF